MRSERQGKKGDKRAGHLNEDTVRGQFRNLPSKGHETNDQNKSTMNQNMKKHHNGSMNGRNNNNSGPAIWGILGVVVITCFDLATRRGYIVKGSCSIGTGKRKKSGWLDCKPGKGGRN